MSLKIIDLSMFATKAIFLPVLLISIDKRAMITKGHYDWFFILPLVIDMSFVQNSYMKTSAEKTFQ